MPAPKISLARVRAATPPQRRIVLLLAVLTALAIGSAALFLTWGVDGHWDFALPRRSAQLLALAIVGVAIATSTVAFHTVTANRILTPSIMGFDALYVLIATTVVFAAGSSAVASSPRWTTFALNTILMVGAATALYRAILGSGKRGLYTLILVGVIAGTLMRSLTEFMVRVMDPNEFDALMRELYASFNRIDTTLLGIGGVILVAGVAGTVAMRRTLDVLSLGRERAISLGVDYQRTVTQILMLIAVLVSVATALVGPITFLGLLVANLAYQLTRTYRHGLNLAVASLVAVVALIAGQGILQHVFSLNATLASLINLIGGVYIIMLIVKESRR